MRNEDDHGTAAFHLATHHLMMIMIIIMLIVRIYTTPHHHIYILCRTPRICTNLATPLHQPATRQNTSRKTPTATATATSHHTHSRKKTNLPSHKDNQGVIWTMRAYTCATGDNQLVHSKVLAPQEPWKPNRLVSTSI